MNKIKLFPYHEADDIYPDEMKTLWTGSEESFYMWKKAYKHWRKIALREREYWQSKVSEDE